MSPVFDPRDIEREPSIELVDEGQYAVKIHKCTSTEDNFAHKVRVFYQIISESAKGKLLMNTFNIGHSKPDVERISKSQFATLLDCIGMGKTELNQFSDIEGKELRVDVGIVPHYNDPGQTQNKIKKHMPMGAINLTPQKQKSEDDLPF